MRVADAPGAMEAGFAVIVTLTGLEPACTLLLEPQPVTNRRKLKYRAGTRQQRQQRAAVFNGGVPSGSPAKAWDFAELGRLFRYGWLPFLAFRSGEEPGEEKFLSAGHPVIAPPGETPE